MSIKVVEFYEFKRAEYTLGCFGEGATVWSGRFKLLGRSTVNLKLITNTVEVNTFYYDIPGRSPDETGFANIRELKEKWKKSVRYYSNTLVCGTEFLTLKPLIEEAG